MIVTEKKPINEIIENLERANAKSVHLFGCDTCAQQCKTGGEVELKEMTTLLTDKGFEVTGTSLVDETCYTQLAKREFRQKEELKGADAVLVLACGAGVKCVADSAEETQPILPALNSMFLTSVERVGKFYEGCSLCGNCVLADTGGICPHTDCPKSLLNGPCGGVDNGKCEVYTENDCAWVRIYDRLKEQGRLDIMTEFVPPKDHSVQGKPHKVLLR
ncbi:MAG: methylenetetrahydrofolate reductase C-terminal domain-containing protein [Deltaproteobacteria bacterium]|nr:methylenetetrahydrofolate reductase C-terminal domain-containing protein [Deltaproteobacteria bacterium]